MGVEQGESEEGRELKIRMGGKFWERKEKNRERSTDIVIQVSVKCGWE